MDGAEEGCDGVHPAHDGAGRGCFFLLGFRVPRGSSFPGMCAVLRVSVSFVVVVISQSYSRHRQNARSGVQIGGLRQHAGDS